MKCEWKRLLTKPRRGIHCTLNYIMPDDRFPTYGKPCGSICGCGQREEVSKKYSRRIVRRRLQRELRELS